MNLYIVIQDNPIRVKRGTILDKSLEGFQEMVTKTNEEGHLVPTIYTGPVIYLHELEDYVVPLPKRKGKVNNEKLEKRLRS